MEEFMQQFAKMVAKEVVQMMGAPQQDDGLIPRKDVMEKLGISPNTLWRWQREGKLHPIKIGRKIFFKKSEIYGNFQKAD